MDWLKNPWVILLLILLGASATLFYLKSSDENDQKQESGSAPDGEDDAKSGDPFPLTEGDEGANVLDLQKAMNKELERLDKAGKAPVRASPVDEDGDFGPGTAALATSLRLYQDAKVTKEEFQSLGQ